MNITTEAFKKLIEEQFDGNYNECAKSLDLAPSTVWRIATGNSKPGIKTITNIVKYCNEKHIKYDSYVFFKLFVASKELKRLLNIVLTVIYILII